MQRVLCEHIGQGHGVDGRRSQGAGDLHHAEALEPGNVAAGQVDVWPLEQDNCCG